MKKLSSLLILITVFLYNSHAVASPSFASSGISYEDFMVWQQNPSSGSLRATLVDEVTRESVPGAVVELFPSSDTTRKRYSTSIADGIINVQQIPYGTYHLRISFLGYDNIERDVTIGRATVNLGTLELVQKAQRIRAVSVEGQALRTSQKGDTITYNANAFKVTRDADAESLLSKMPGITVIDGQVEAQGETVEKIFVDGKEFFGQDVSTTIKTIPAEVISKIEVYNKLSDQAEFTGVDDGEGFKAINIVTTVNKGSFGKSYATWGIDDMYSIGTNTNYFYGEHRFSFIGMANNVNQQNFAMEDILGAVSGGQGGMSSRGGGRMRWRGMGMMVPQLDGISTTQAVGINYSGSFAKKVDITASYFFNNSKNDNENEIFRQYIDGRDWLYEANNISQTKNHEHRFRSRIDYKINENHNLMMRTNLSFQNYNSFSQGLATTYEPEGSIFDFVRRDTTSNDSKRNGYTIGNTIIYRVNLGKPGRALTLDLGGRISNNDATSRSYSLAEITGSPDNRIDQRTESDTKSYNLNGSIMYAEPITQYSQVNAEYRVNYNYSDIDRQAYLWDWAIDDYYFSPDYSNKYNSGYLTHRVGPGYNYAKDRNNFNANVSYQRSVLDNDHEFPNVYSKKTTFDNVVYHARMETAFNPTATLRIRMHSRTSNPSIGQLQDVVDISNSQFITSGNPNLKPEYTHNLFANFVKTNTEKGRTFMIMGRYSIQSNYIGDYVITDENSTSLPTGVVLEKGGQYSSYRNYTGSWNADAGISYGFPLNPIKSNINLGVNGAWRKTPSMLDDVKSITTGQYYFGNITIGSNISENIDFTIQYNAGYNLASNSKNPNYDNEYFVQYASLRFKFVMWAGITLSGNVAYTQNKGITDEYNDQFVMCNIFVGKKIFKNQRGELIFGVNDLFDQTTNFRRNVTAQYIENVTSKALGRYFGIQFVYNLRTFGGQSAPTGGDSMRYPGVGGGIPPGGMR